jgi:beta-mannosidase
MKIVKWIITIMAIAEIWGASFAQDQGKSLNLSGTWKLTWANGGHGPKSFSQLAEQEPLHDLFKYVDAEVPGEIHDVFKGLGVIGDPNYGINLLHADWVGDQYYQYYRTFNLPEDVLGQEQWLVFDQLDLVANIYLNGEKIGSHQNAFYPCRINVTGKTKTGVNTMSVLLESGLFSVADKEGQKYGFKRGLQQMIDKRHYLRKPQYQFNWDWNPRYVNVGITGKVRLEWSDNIMLDQLSVSQTITDDLEKTNITVRSFIEGVNENQQIEIVSRIEETGAQGKRIFNIEKGMNVCPVNLEIVNPRLWWPIGQGEPFRYTLVTTIYSDGKHLASETRKLGIRKVEVDQSPHPVKGNYFTVKINNRPVFMKGGNWIPPDLTYSHITYSRLDSLVNLAVEANFNSLRIWGGGLYAGNDLLDLCDEKGILVWHDFIFACSVYPGDDPDFYNNVQKEVTWIVREYNYHPSLIAWCGNNENEMIFWDYELKNGALPDSVIFEGLLPEIIKNEGSDAFYWPSSPHSPNNLEPRNVYSGDQHPWGVSLRTDGVNIWAYRGYEDRFPNEGGVLGASSPATLKQMLEPDQYFLRSFAWDHHDNLKNFQKNNLGLTYRAFEFLYDKPYNKVPFEAYLFGSALFHSEGLQEYIYNYRRRKFDSSAAIFWMYNDSWPVTHGWTIVDYYLRKKLAFHPVRRAFDEVVVVLTREGEDINVYGVNDMPVAWKGNLRYGFFTLDGKKPIDKRKHASIPANSSVILASFSAIAIEKAGIDNSGAFALLQKDGELVSQNKLLISYFKNLPFKKPTIHIQLDNGKAVFESDDFVWGVTLDIDGESDVTDNCFDLFPGIPYSIAWPDNTRLPVVLRTGNDLLVK